MLLTLLIFYAILFVYIHHSNSPIWALLIYPFCLDALTNISSDFFLIRLIKIQLKTCAHGFLFSAFAIRAESMRAPYPRHNSFRMNTYEKDGGGGGLWLTSRSLLSLAPHAKRPPQFPERALFKSFRSLQPITGAASRSFRRRAKWCMAMFMKISPQEVLIESTRASVS